MLNADSRKNALYIILARGVSDFGAFLNMVALPTYVYLVSGSVMQISILLAARVGGGVLASLIGASFFRRFIGKWSLIVFDLLRAFLLIILLFLPLQIQLYVLPIIAFGIGLGNSMFSIGLNSQLPYLIVATQRVSVNAWIASIAASAVIFGSLVSGLLAATHGFKVVFELNIITYLLAGFIILPLKIIIAPDASQNQTKKSWRNLFSALEGNKILASILLVSMADTFGSAAHNVGFPILSKLITPQSASVTMGLIIAMWGVGKFSGARLASLILKNRNQLFMERLFIAGVFLMSSGFILLFAESKVLFLIPFAIWAGVGDGLAEVSLISRIQQEPDQVRLPIFSLLTFLQMTGFGIGMLVVAPFFIWWPPVLVLLLFHGIPLAMVTIMIIKMRQHFIFKDERVNSVAHLSHE
jgi:hypothetical protein